MSISDFLPISVLSSLKRPLKLIFLTIGIVQFCSAQTPTLLNLPTSINSNTTAPYLTAQQNAHEQLGLATGSIHLFIPAVSLPQRGGRSLDLGFVYSNNTSSLKETAAAFTSFYPDESGTNVSLVPTQLVISAVEGSSPPWGPVHPNLPTLNADLTFAGSSYPHSVGDVSGNPQNVVGPIYCVQNWSFTGQDGNVHPFHGRRDCTRSDAIQGETAGIVLTGQATDSYDGSGYMLDATNAADIKVIGPDGVVYHFNGYTSPPQATSFDDDLDRTSLFFYARVASSIVDTNGNTISISTQNGAYTVQDTVGRTINVTPQSITYTAMNGSSSQSVTALEALGSGSSETVPWPIQYAAGKPCSYNPPASYPAPPPATVYYEGPGYSSSSGPDPNTYPASSSLSVTLPNGEQYILTFDVAGQISKIQYPSGGYTRYDHEYKSLSNENFGDVSCQVPGSILLAKHECDAAGGDCTQTPSTLHLGDSCTPGTPVGGEATTCYSGQYLVYGWEGLDVDDPMGNRTHYDFSEGRITSNPFDGGDYLPPYEFSRKYYSGTSTLLKTVTTDYTNTSSCPQSTTWAEPCTITTSYNDASSAPSSAVTMQYDVSSGISNPTQIQETNFLGNVVRTTVNTWEHGGIYADTAPPSGALSHILDRLESKTISDAVTGQSHTLGYTYDGHANLHIVKVTASDAASTTTQYGYNDYGDRIQAIDPKGNQTNYGYSNPFEDSACSAVTDSAGVPSSITNALGRTTVLSYYSCSGQMASSTDPNGAVSNFTYDTLGRSLSRSVQGSNNVLAAQESYSYKDTAPLTVTHTVAKYSTSQITTKYVLDGLGRLHQTQLMLDSNEADYVDKTYDALGRVASVSNPYRNISDPTYGVTLYNYDALARVTLQTQPDGSKLQWCYDGAASTGQSNCLPSKSSKSGVTWEDFSDESGRHWQRAHDALGRLVAVMELGKDDSSFSLETDYTYSGLGNLLTVSQQGASGEIPRARSFTYDSLSRLITSTNAENKTICYGIWSGSNCVYGYDLNGNLLNRTDARGIVTAYSYDALSRLISKSFSGETNPDGTPSAHPTLTSCYSYDAGFGAGSNSIGRLTGEWTQAGSCPASAQDIPPSAMSWKNGISYDAMGRLTDEIQCPVAPCLAPSPMHYSYDLAGNVTHQGNGLANSQSPQIGWTNSYDDASRLKQIVSDWSDPGHPATLFRADTDININGVSHAPYGPFGLTAAQYGISETDGTVALAEQRDYDNRGRLITKNIFGSNSPTIITTATSVAANPTTFNTASATTIVINVNCNSACGLVDIHVDTVDLGNQTLDTNGSISVSSASFPISALSIGQHAVIAQYLGDSTHAPSSGQTTYTVTSSSQFLTLSMSNNAFTVGENSRIQVHAACNSACGSVTLSVDGQTWRVWNLDSAGNLVLDSWFWEDISPNFSNVGQHVLVAHFSGNSTYPASDSDGYSYTIQSVGTQQAVPSLTMSSISFTSGDNSHISIHHPCNSACGQIVLNIDGNFYRNLQLDGSGNAYVDTFWWWTPLFTVGNHTMTAQYLGNHTYAPADATPVSFTIQNIGTQQATVSLSIPAAFGPGSATPLVVQVDCNSACGVVQLTVDGNEWRTWNLYANGTLSIDALHWPPPLLTPGSHTIKAHFYGNATYAPADSAPQTVTVAKFLTLSMSNNAFTAGENSRIQVHAACNSACGSVTLSVDGQTWRVWNLDSGGNLILDSWFWDDISPNFSNVGQHVLVAHFGGNSTYPASDSDGYSYTIQSVGTQQAVPSFTMSSISFTSGDNSHISLHHPCNSACGQIVLNIDGSFYRNLQLDSSGNAYIDTFWWWTPLFAVGNHTMTAQYLGNHTYAPADATPVSFAVQNIGTQQTTVSLSIPTAFGPGSATPLVVQVDCNSACGVVQLTVDGNEWRAWNLYANGTLSIDALHWPTPLLTPGNHTIKAHFYGNATYAPADSAPQTVTVAQ